MPDPKLKYFEYLESKGQLPKDEEKVLNGEEAVKWDDDLEHGYVPADEKAQDKLYALDEEGESHVEHFSDGGLVGHSPIAHLLNALKKKRG